MKGHSQSSPLHSLTSQQAALPVCIRKKPQEKMLNIEVPWQVFHQTQRLSDPASLGLQCHVARCFGRNEIHTSNPYPLCCRPLDITVSGQIIFGLGVWRFVSVCSSLARQWILEENISNIVILGLRCWPARRPLGFLHNHSMGCHRCRDTWYKEIVI